MGNSSSSSARRSPYFGEGSDEGDGFRPRHIPPASTTPPMNEPPSISPDKLRHSLREQGLVVAESDIRDVLTKQTTLVKYVNIFLLCPSLFVAPSILNPSHFLTSRISFRVRPCLVFWNTVLAVRSCRRYPCPVRKTLSLDSSRSPLFSLCLMQCAYFPHRLG